MATTWTEHGLVELLRARHAAPSVFVAGPKMGQAGSRILDGWAMLATWSPWTTIGYEIKCSRSDWLGDQKYLEYLPTCHLFFVVAPKGVVVPSELPPGVGLLEPIGQGTGARLVTRLKAARREPDHRKVCKVMAYCLMWRQEEFGLAAFPSRQRAAETLAQWAATNGPFKDVAQAVSRRMREEVRAAHQRAHQAEAQLQALQEWVAVLQHLGIDQTYTGWDRQRQVERALAAHGMETLARLDDALGMVRRVRDEVAAALAREGEGPR